MENLLTFFVGICYYNRLLWSADGNPRHVHYSKYVCRNTSPKLFEQALHKAKEYVDTHNLPVPLITINSWNEWTETSYLEPDTKFGYGYLEAIKRVFVDE